MPYIAEANRKDLLDGTTFPETVGELNFILTTRCV